MREILFRGKRKDNGEWVEGFYVCLFEKENGFYKAKHYIFDGNTKLGEERYCGHGNYEQDVKICKFEVVPETVGQFTGLTDKNGKKIFEGDVVKFTNSPFGYSFVGVVCFNEGSFCIKYEYLKKEKFHRIGQTDKWQDMGASGIVTYQYEILSNIHDNPELLKDARAMAEQWG